MQENFILNLHHLTGLTSIEYIAKKILDSYAKTRINLKLCKGQSSDNTPNMQSVKKGVTRFCQNPY